MNTAQIVSTAKTLISLGFDLSIEQQLLQRIPFQQSSFMLVQRKRQGFDTMNFKLHFNRNDAGDYLCQCYDAILRKSITIPPVPVQDIDVGLLENRVAAIDWSSYFSPEIIEESISLKIVEQVEAVITDLLALGVTTQGAELLTLVKVKYWSDTPVEEIFDGFSQLRSRFEISQRFYFFEGEVAISTEESYRYLNNKWLEKQMQVKRKLLDETTDRGEEYNKVAINTATSKKNKSKSI